MPNRVVIILDRIEARLQALDLSPRKASLIATGKPDAIRAIQRGQVPSAERLARLASALQTTTAYLQGETDSPSVGHGGLIPAPLDMPRDIPVYGTALGAEESFWSEHDGEVAIEQTDISSGEVIDYYRRPPALRDRRDVYMLYTAGDSMAPAYEAGQAIPVDPSRPPAIGNYVVVYLRAKGGDDEGTAAVLIKRLVKRGAGWIELEQFNPPARFRLQAGQYRAVHRVMSLDEVLGV